MPYTALLASFADGLIHVWDFLRSGGEVMFLIVAASIASVSIIIIKALQLRDHILFPKHIVAEIEQVEQYATKGDITPLQQMLEEDGSVAAQLGIIAISGKYETREENNEACETAARGILHRLENGVPMLEVLVTVSPLLGLLGAVMGLVTVFSNYSSGSEISDNDSMQVAKGIAEALHATIAGLLVAIPTLLAHGYFSRKLDAISVQMEMILRRAIHDFHRHFEVRRTPVKDK
jgi:biopolymer transport protein ExbB